MRILGVELWIWGDFAAALLALLTLIGIWHFHFRTRRIRRCWRCVRWGGGGALDCPRPMSIEEVTRWLAHDNNAEIGHIDHDNGFIFYRPRGGA